jgi:hypothetical protein
MFAIDTICTLFYILHELMISSCSPTSNGVTKQLIYRAKPVDLLS